MPGASPAQRPAAILLQPMGAPKLLHAGVTSEVNLSSASPRSLSAVEHYAPTRLSWSAENINLRMHVAWFLLAVNCHATEKVSPRVTSAFRDRSSSEVDLSNGGSSCPLSLESSSPDKTKVRKLLVSCQHSHCFAMFYRVSSRWCSDCNCDERKQVRHGERLL